MPFIQMFPGLSSAPKPVEELLKEAFAAFDVPVLGGPSEDGWSKMNEFQRCPYRYKLLFETEKEEGISGAKPDSLEIGSLWHAVLACHYIGSVDGALEYPTPFVLLDKLADLGANVEHLAEVRRLYLSYFEKYRAPHDEGVKPLAIELGAGIPGQHTCRFDMLARFGGGTWIFEHKTASRESREATEGWWLDGEIIGEVLGYQLSGLDRIYGPLVGVVVNVAFKTKEPKFRRIEVVITNDIIAQYVQDRGYWAKLRDSMRVAGYWPRKLNGCIGRYGMCDFWDHCRDASTTDDARLNRLLNLSIEGLKKG